MNLRDEPPSKHFVDKTGQPPSLKTQLDYFLWGLVNKDKVANNNAFVRRNRNSTHARQIQNMTVSDFTPEEWRLVKENGFGLDDILVMRKFNRSGRVSPAQANVAAN